MGRLSLPFSSYLFTLVDISQISCSSSDHPDRLHARTHVFVATLQGSGGAVIDGRRRRLTRASCFLLSPDTLFDVFSDNASELKLVWLSFRAAPVAEEEGGHTAAAPFDCPPYEELNAQPFAQIAGRLEELLRHRDEEEELARFKQHLRLQELLYELCRSSSDPGGQLQSREAVRRSIDRLHRLDLADMSVDALARQANIGARQYTHLFKQLTGKSPVDYMTELRLNQAKKQLLTSNESLQRIAQRAGFKDVYYFSRRFKQMVGQSPKQYVRNTREGMRIVALYYANVLLSIGVKPIGANLTWWGGSTFLQEMEQGIVDIGCEPSLEAVSRLEPDLILMNDANLSNYGAMSKIAPTVLLPYEGQRNIFEDVRLIGRLINRPHAADELESRFELRAAEVRERLSGIVGRQPVAAIVRFEREGREFSVFGDNYGRSGWPIYRGLRFGIPEYVQRQAIDSGLQIVQNLPLEKLPLYAANAEYLFVSDEGEGIRHVQDNPIWRSLPAVEQGRAYVLDRASFSFFDPISIEGQLELLAQLLTKGRTAS